MEMTEEQILEEADRIRERRGLKVVRECARCGASFAAEPGERFCSDDCRITATSNQVNAIVEEGSEAPPSWRRRRGETVLEYWTRTFERPLSEDEIEDAVVLQRIRDMKIKPIGKSSLELIHEGREERFRQILGT